jgi:phosphate transport system permease protein
MRPLGAVLPKQRPTRSSDRLLTIASALSTAIIALMVIVLLTALVVGGYPVLSPGFLFEGPRGGIGAGGVGPAIVGTLALTLLMTVVVLPVGVGTAIYLAEFANPRSPFSRTLRVGMANLAGVPSVVLGLFGLGFFVQTIGRALDRSLYRSEATWGQPGLLWAALTMAVLTLPTVVVTVEEALRAVPTSLREAGLALGATRFQTTFGLVVPRARGGIATALILAVSRGAGEVAPVLLTGAAYYVAELPTHPNDPFMHLGYHAYVLATQSADVDRSRPFLFGTVLVLLGLTFALNLTAWIVRARVRRALELRAGQD